MKFKSIEHVYSLYMNDIYRYLLQLAANPETAEDLLQDVFVKAYEHIELYRKENVRSWLFKIACNIFIDWYRKEKRLIHTDPHAFASIAVKDLSPEDSYLIKEQINRWLKAVMTLPARSRQVILLRDYYDFTYQEIADMLGLTLSNVKVKLLRARHKVNEVMNNDL